MAYWKILCILLSFRLPTSLYTIIMLSTTEPPHSPSLSHSDSKSLCRSQASSHSSSSQPLLAQIAQLKQKAHQSFMQVMQMQQLHEQELQLLRNDQAQRQEGLLQRIQELQEGIQRQEGLELRVKQLENENLEMERNWRLRFCEMEEDLSIDSVQPIPGKDEGTDDEEVSHLREVLQLYSNEEEFQAVKEQMVKELQQIGGNSNVEISSSGGNTPQSPLPELIRKVLAYVSSLRKECSRLLLAERQHEGKQKVAKSPVKEPATAGSPSKEIERLEREGKFMAEQIKRLSTDKLRAQKRTAEAERELKIVQDKIGKATSALSKKGINLDGLLQGTTTRVLDHDHSLQLDEFVSQNLRNSFKSHPIASPLKPHQPLLAKTTHR